MRRRVILAALAFAAAAAAACGKSNAPIAAGGTGTPPAVRRDDRVFAGGIAPAAYTFPGPFAGGAQAAKEGGELFTSMNCDGCHGGGGTGWVGPSLSDGRWRYGGTDADIFNSIYSGQPHGMPAFGGILPPAMIWKLVAYLKSLPKPEDVPTERW
jgi:cytochrome c oxidase cbb3-type subunit III